MMLEQFLVSEARNKWLAYDNFHVYVRKGIHRHNGRCLDTLDIANITVDEDYRSRGIFRRFISHVEDLVELPIYVESILEPRLVDFFKRRGYTITIDCGGVPSAILLKDVLQ